MGSGWNTNGNTYEQKDFSKWGRKRFEELLADVKLDSCSLSGISAEGDLQCTLGKKGLKTIYDIGFKADVNVGDDAKKVKIHVCDIMPDDEPDDWDITITKQAYAVRNRFEQAVQAAVPPIVKQ